MIGRAGFAAVSGLDQVSDAGAVGDEDNTIPNSLSKEMADNIHGAKLVILENCGHLPQVEQPQATAAALVGMAARLVVSAPRTA